MSCVCPIPHVVPVLGVWVDDHLAFNTARQARARRTASSAEAVAGVRGVAMAQVCVMVFPRHRTRWSYPLRAITGVGMVGLT